MLDSDQITQVDVYTMTGLRLISTRTGFGFPENYDLDSANSQVVIRGASLPVYDRGKAIITTVYTRAGDRIQYVGKVTYSDEKYFGAIIRIDKPRLLVERRRYFKIRVSDDCLIMKYIPAGEGLCKELNYPIPAMITDINLGGVFLTKTSLKLGLDDNLRLQFSFDNKEIELNVLVLRIQIKQSTGELEGYGCRFINVTPAQEDLISSYVNSLQIKQRRLERERESGY